MMDTNTLVGDRIQTRQSSEQIRSGLRRSASADFYDDLQMGPCLVVSREMGSGGSQIASKVATRLGWAHLDKEIIGKLASRYGTPRVVLDAVDEKKVGWLTDVLNGWIEGHGFSQLAYVNRLGQLFNLAAKQGNVVIVGRGAKFLLPKTAAFSVRIVAPMDFRVEQIVLRHGISVMEARALIQQSDADRHAFVKSFFHHDVADPHVHDLVINIKEVTTEYAVQLIFDAVQFWMNRNGFEPRQRAIAS